MRASPLAVFILAVLLSSAPCRAEVSADLDGDGDIDKDDLYLFMRQWDLSQGPTPIPTFTASPTETPPPPTPTATPTTPPGPQVGWSADLVALPARFQTYGATGTAVITATDTLQLRNFSYKNNGPDVHVYLIHAAGPGGFTGAEGDAGTSIHQFSNNPGQPFNNTTLDLQLPEGVAFQNFTHVSIWCAAFSVDFASGRFQPPKAKPIPPKVP